MSNEEEQIMVDLSKFNTMPIHLLDLHFEELKYVYKEKCSEQTKTKSKYKRLNYNTFVPIVFRFASILSLYFLKVSMSFL